MNQLRFQLALVTGASSGLGKALCELLAAEKIALIIAGRNQEQLAKLASTLSNYVPVQICVCDLSIKEDRHTLIDVIHHSKPDLVINNAGFGLYGNVLDHPTSDQMEILEVNGNALMEIAIEAARTLAAAKMKGTILNVSSAASFFVYPGFSVYAASKTFVNQFSRAFDAELAPSGIRVLAACPGQIATNFRLRASKNFPQRKDSNTMSSEKAAKCILHQIKTGKQLYIFDAYYRFVVFLGRLLCPNTLLQKILKKKLSSRYVK
ncbi:MAG TPA: SDR family NAD(P)-dependent oxidoreductase [Rhabdochlamydiaceae bacterium]|nr:SDR family NAD(P)-dependent oxidoreductase [Rhabdochlamydiaceae bacterium]